MFMDVQITFWYDGKHSIPNKWYQSQGQGFDSQKQHAAWGKCWEGDCWLNQHPTYDKKHEGAEMTRVGVMTHYWPWLLLGWLS